MSVLRGYCYLLQLKETMVVSGMHSEIRRLCQKQKVSYCEVIYNYRKKLIRGLMNLVRAQDMKLIHIHSRHVRDTLSVYSVLLYIYQRKDSPAV